MCGFCIEAGFLYRVWDVWMGEEPEDMSGFFQTPCWQDRALLSAMRIPLPGDSARSDMVDVALSWEEFLAQDFSENSFASLCAVAGRSAGNEKVEACLKLLPGSAWMRLLQTVAEGDCNQCRQILANESAQLIAGARSIIDVFVDFWLYAPEKPNESTQMDARGVFDPVAWAMAQGGFDLFEEVVPLVFAALVYLSGKDHEGDEVARLVLTELQRTPVFEGLDLWLRRRAFIHCVGLRGVAFAMEHSQDIRYTMIYYAILKGVLSGADVAVLVDFVRASTERWIFEESVSDVLSMLEEASVRLGVSGVA